MDKKMKSKAISIKSINSYRIYIGFGGFDMRYRNSKY